MSLFYLTTQFFSGTLCWTSQYLAALIKVTLCISLTEMWAENDLELECYQSNS